MIISQQYSWLSQIQQSVTLWYICANLIENESLVTSTNKQNSVTYAKINKIIDRILHFGNRNHCQNYI